MTEATSLEAQAAFAAAKNLNSAIKNFIKREVQNNAELARFAKDFRSAATSGREQAIKSYIEANFAKHENYFLALASYAHPDFFSTTLEKIYSTHAEEFNSTYKKLEKSIQITNKSGFSAVVKKVHELLDARLQEAALPKNAFLKKALMYTIFEPEVLQEVLAVSK